MICVLLTPLQLNLLFHHHHNHHHQNSPELYAVILMDGTQRKKIDCFDKLLDVHFNLDFKWESIAEMIR